jgi:hypothetical protein
MYMMATTSLFVAILSTTVIPSAMAQRIRFSLASQRLYCLSSSEWTEARVLLSGA